MKTALSGMIGAALLLGGSANAADLAVPAYKASVMAPAFSWTGWYIGGNIGAGWGENADAVATPGPGVNFGAGPTSANSTPGGVIGGGQVGYDWQVNRSWVFGLVADFQGADIRGSSSGPGPGNGCAPSVCATEDLRFLGTARGRLGWTAGNWLLYGTGGVAYGSVNSTENFSNLIFPITGSRSETRVGWTGGVGVNYAMTQNWVVGLEYLHYDLGTTSVTGTDASGKFSATVDQKVGGDIVRGVINYKF
jgi:outer membrane immunogenic protein